MQSYKSTMVRPMHSRRLESSTVSTTQASEAGANGRRFRRSHHSLPSRTDFHNITTHGLRNITPWAQRAITSIFEYNPRLYHRWSDAIFSSDSDSDTHDESTTTDSSSDDDESDDNSSDSNTTMLSERDEDADANQRSNPDHDRVSERFVMMMQSGAATIRCV